MRVIDYHVNQVVVNNKTIEVSEFFKTLQKLVIKAKKKTATYGL